MSSHSNKFFSSYFAFINKAVLEVDPDLLERVVCNVEDTKKNYGKLILVGNGGSAAMASHVSVDLTKVAGVRAINFNEADLLTCFANDYGYENWVQKAIEFYADKNDLIILISSSGKSLNIINGANKAREMGLFVVTLSGFSPDNPLKKLGAVNLWCDSQSYNVVEMSHHIWLLAIVDLLAERRLS